MQKIKIILFNLIEMLCILLIGKLLKISFTHSLIIMFVFIITRMTFGKTLHYKSPYRCFIMTLSIFLSLFVAFKVNIYLSLIISAFDGYLLTGKANIEDMFMWNGKASKYQDIIEFINDNPEKMLDFEERLQKYDNLDYLIYKYRFKENLSFDKITKLLDIDSPRIAEKQDKVALAIKMVFKI